MSSTSMHDSGAATPLMEMTKCRVTGLYQLMDAVYYSSIIEQPVRSLGQIPIIDKNGKRRKDVVPMDKPTAKRYNERSTAKRGNAKLKDEFGARYVRVRGHVKVMAHLIFGILALAAEQIMRLLS